MKHQSRLNTRQAQSEQQQAAANQAEQAALDFASVEDLIRHDALHTPVPPGIAQRLQQTLGPGRGNNASWWRRFFHS